MKLNIRSILAAFMVFTMALTSGCVTKNDGEDDKKKATDDYEKIISIIKDGDDEDAEKRIENLLSYVTEDDIDEINSMDIDNRDFDGLNMNFGFIIDWYYHYNLVQGDLADNEKLIEKVNQIVDSEDGNYFRNFPENKSVDGVEEDDDVCSACGGTKNLVEERVGGETPEGMLWDGKAEFYMCENCGWAHLRTDEMIGTYSFKRRYE